MSMEGFAESQDPPQDHNNDDSPSHEHLQNCENNGTTIKKNNDTLNSGSNQTTLMTQNPRISFLSHINPIWDDPAVQQALFKRTMSSVSRPKENMNYKAVADTSFLPLCKRFKNQWSITNDCNGNNITGANKNAFIGDVSEDLRHFLNRKRLANKNAAEILKVHSLDESRSVGNQTLAENTDATVNLCDIQEAVYDPEKVKNIDMAPLKRIVSRNLHMNVWSMLVDKDIILLHYRFLKMMSDVDETLRLLVLDNVLKDIQSAIISNQTPLRRVARRALSFISKSVKFGKAFVVKDPGAPNPSSRTYFLDSCQKYLSGDNNVLLLSNNRYIQKVTRFALLPHYTLNDVKRLVGYDTTEPDDGNETDGSDIDEIERPAAGTVNRSIQTTNDVHEIGIQTEKKNPEKEFQSKGAQTIETRFKLNSPERLDFIEIKKTKDLYCASSREKQVGNVENTATMTNENDSVENLCDVLNYAKNNIDISKSETATVTEKAVPLVISNASCIVNNENHEIIEHPESNKNHESNENLESNENPESKENPESIKCPQTNENPGCIENNESNESPESREYPESNEYSESNENPESNEKSKSNNNPESNENPESIECPQTNENPESSEYTESNENPKSSEYTESNENPESSEYPDSNEYSESNYNPESNENPECYENPESIESTESNENPESNEHPESNENPKMKENPELNFNPESYGNAENIPTIYIDSDSENSKYFMIEVTSHEMEEHLKTKNDVWVSRFVQIMNKLFLQLLAKDPFHCPYSLPPPPWSLQEMAQCFKMKYITDADIVDGADKLTEMLLNCSDQNGKIGGYMSPNLYMKMYSYGVYLISSLQVINHYSEDLKNAAESMSKLLIEIQNPKQKVSLDDKRQETVGNECSLTTTNPEDVTNVAIGICGDSSRKRQLNTKVSDCIGCQTESSNRTRRYNLRSLQKKPKQKDTVRITQVQWSEAENEEDVFFSSLHLRKAVPASIDGSKSNADMHTSVHLQSELIPEANVERIEDKRSDDFSTNEKEQAETDMQPDEPKIVKVMDTAKKISQMEIIVLDDSDLEDFRSGDNFAEPEVAEDNCNNVNHNVGEQLKEKSETNTLAKNGDDRLQQVFNKVLLKIYSTLRRGQAFCEKTQMKLKFWRTKRKSNYIPLKSVEYIEVFKKLCESFNSINTCNLREMPKIIAELIGPQETCIRDLPFNEYDMEKYRTLIGICGGPANLLCDTLQSVLNLFYLCTDGPPKRKRIRSVDTPGSAADIIDKLSVDSDDDNASWFRFDIATLPTD